MRIFFKVLHSKINLNKTEESKCLCYIMILNFFDYLRSLPVTDDTDRKNTELE